MPIPAAAASSFGSQLGQSAAIGAGMSAGSGLLGQLFGGINARRQWKYMKKQMNLQQQYALEQMQKQYEYQKSMFDYENAYNDPSKVMERYRAAGVNPSAVLGSSGASMSATMPVGPGPSGSSISPGQPIGAGTPANLSADALTASQIRLNNANAENAQSAASLSSEKAITEASVRNVLAATVDEKTQNAYFAEQKGIYQELVNAKTPAMLDAQISQLRAHADQLISSGKLSDEQVSLVRAQAVETFFNAGLKRAMTDTQSEISKYYREQAGFISLQSDDLDRTIDSLSTTEQVTTFTMNGDGEAIPVTYKISGYDAKRLTSLFGSMRGAAEAAREAIKADWENPNQWNAAIDVYWDNVNASAKAVSDIIQSSNPLRVASSSVKSIFDGNGQLIGGSELIRTPYRR